MRADNLTERIAQAKLAVKYFIANFVKKGYFDDKLINLKKTNNKVAQISEKKDMIFFR